MLIAKYDPQPGSLNVHRTASKIRVLPLTADGSSYNIDRQRLCERASTNDVDDNECALSVANASPITHESQAM